jgi:methylase of polypeptide subunit release factors
MMRMPPATPRPLRIFFAYAHADEELRDKLDSHLAALKHEGRVEVWHDRRISPGYDWRLEIGRELETADIILLLVSASFLDSDFCQSVELRTAVERHQKGAARVIPILLRPCDVKGTPIEALQQLPRDARPITKWRNRDEACQHVAESLRTVVEEWHGPGAAASPPVRDQPPRRAGRGVLDTIDFSALAEILREVDTYVLRQLRDRRLTMAEESAQVYRHLLTSKLKDEGVEFAALYERLHDPEFMARLLQTVPEPALTVDIGSNFEWIVYTDGQDLELRVDRPRLLWDCFCRQLPRAAKECPIHRHGAMAAEVSQRFGTRLVALQWRGLRFYWRDGLELWPPARDAFLLFQTLEERRAMGKGTASLLDIGSGTGFLGIAAARSSPSIRSAYLADWLLTPALFGQLNWMLNRRKDDTVRVRSLIGMHTNWLLEDELRGSVFDLAICNPPYLPKLAGHEELALDTTVCGTDLLEHVIRRAATLARRTYIQFSTIAMPEARRAAEAAGVQLVPIGERHLVPFRVPTAVDRPGYVEALKKRGLKQRRGANHPYWHSLTAVSVN